MSESVRYPLKFYMDREDEKRAYEILQSQPEGSMKAYLIRAVLKYHENFELEGIKKQLTDLEQRVLTLEKEGNSKSGFSDFIHQYDDG